MNANIPGGITKDAALTGKVLALYELNETVIGQQLLTGTLGGLEFRAYCTKQVEPGLLVEVGERLFFVSAWELVYAARGVIGAVPQGVWQ